MAKTVTVTVERPGGLVMRFFREGREADGSTRFSPDPDRPAIELKTGSNPGIAAELWAEWLEQNKASALVTGGFVVASDDPEA